MVRFLLEAGADQEHKTDEMHTALMEACMVRCLRDRSRARFYTRVICNCNHTLCIAGSIIRVCTIHLKLAPCLSFANIPYILLSFFARCPSLQVEGLKGKIVKYHIS